MLTRRSLHPPQAQCPTVFSRSADTAPARLPTPRRAQPADALDLLAWTTLLAQAVRGQWSIESLHWIRDTIYREDDSQARTKSGPRVMAALRNPAIGALKLFGRQDIAEAARWATRKMERPFTILGLTT